MARHTKSSVEDLPKLISQLRQPEKRYAAIHRFRSEYPLDKFVGAYRRLFPTPDALKDYFGPSTPRKETTPYTKSPPRAMVTTAREILWGVARSIQSSTVLSDFVACRRRFEHLVALNDQASCNEVLDQVESKFGISIWLLQNRMAVAYLSASETEASVTADAIMRRAKPNWVLSVMLTLIRRRVEGVVDRDKQKEMLEKSLEATPQSFRDYCRTKLLEPTNSQEQSVGATLYYDSQVSAIDHYESLITGLRAAISDDKIDPLEYFSNALHQLRLSNGDERLDPLIAGLGGKLSSAPIDRERACIIEHYSAQNYSDVISSANIYLSNNPEDSPIRMVYVKACAALAARPSATGKNLVDDINDSLYNICVASEHFYRSVHSLLTLVNRFLGVSWMEYLRVAVLYEIGAESQVYPPTWLRDIYIRDCNLTPFSVVALPSDRRSATLSHFDLAAAYPITREAALITLGDAVARSERSGPAARNQARFDLAAGRFDSAAELYKIAASSQSGAARLRCIGGQALAHLCKGELGTAIDTIVDAYLDNPHAPTLLPVINAVSTLEDPEQWPDSINQSILLALASAISEEEAIAAQRFAFERCQTQLGVSKPSELAEQAQTYGLKNVVAYMDTVWRPEIMKQTLLYADSNEIEEARIEVCKVLASIDPPGSARYTAELTGRIKQQEISKVTNLVEQSKVYVDVEAIKRALNTRLATSYSRYKSAFNQSEKSSNSIVTKLSEALADVTAASLPTVLSKVHLVDIASEPVGQADLQFDAFFSEITNEFLKGDHGLNAYLSTRVRHGKFVDALRKGVMDEGLVTSQGTDGVYLKNTHWTRPDQFSSAQWDKVKEELAVFSKSFDELLFHTRDKLLQIRIASDMKTADSNPGLFLYHSSWLERRLMQTYDQRFTSFDEFISRCVDSLWEKTDANLTLVRQTLSEHVGASLMKVFDSLEIGVGGALGVSYGPLLNAIAQARTATQSALSHVVSWFNRSEVYDRADYAIDFPARIAFNMARRTLSVPPSWEGPRINSHSNSSLLPGRTLDRMVDIFYVFLENAVKRAPLNGIDIECNINYDGGRFDCEVLSRSLPPASDEEEKLASLRTTLASSESRKLAQNEGKSGFRKVWNSLDHPLFREPRLDFERMSDNRFRVEVSFKVAEAHEAITN